MGRGKTWDAQYTSARAMWWLYGGILAAAMGSAVVVGGNPDVAQSMNALKPYLGIVYVVAAVPVIALLTASLLPRRANITVDPLRVTVVRGRRSTVLRRQKLRVDTQRWEYAPGSEVGTVLVLEDGEERVTVGARDRRIGSPQGRCHSPQIWLEGSVFDEVASALGITMPIVSADAVADEPPERLELSLKRNAARGLAVFAHVAATFGGIIGAAMIGFALEAWVGGSVGEYAMMLVIPGVFVPQILFFTHARRRPASIVVDGEHVTVRIGRKETRVAREALTIGRGMVGVVAGRASTFTTPVLSLQAPWLRPIRIGTHDVRLRWESSGKMRAAHYLLGGIDFQLLAAALGQPLALDHTAAVPPPPSRGREIPKLHR